jgi:hypothetical protein
VIFALKKTHGEASKTELFIKIGELNARMMEASVNKVFL